MAFQVGDIKISGTIDGLSFYKSEFGWLVRTKGGPTRKQLKTSPSFARARENSNEFSLCSRAASSLRNIVTKYAGKKDPTLYHRLIKLMRALADLDQPSPRGNRDPLKGMHNPQAQMHLKNFQITNDLTLYTILRNTQFLKPIQKLRRKNKPPVFKHPTNHSFPIRHQPHKILRRNSEPVTPT